MAENAAVLACATSAVASYADHVGASRGNKMMALGFVGARVLEALQTDHPKTHLDDTLEEVKSGKLAENLPKDARSIDGIKMALVATGFAIEEMSGSEYRPKSRKASESLPHKRPRHDPKHH